MSSPPSLTAILLVAAIALPPWSATRGDSPAMPSPYMADIGESDALRFVMMPGRCVRGDALAGDAAGPDTLRDAVAADPRLATPVFDVCREQTLRDAERLAASGRGGPVALHEWRRERSRRRERLRRQVPESEFDDYPVSGLYRKDGSREPVWAVGWYASGVELTDDGRYLVRQGPWGGPLGVAFYDRGKLLREWPVRALVSDMEKLSYTVSHYFWIDDWKFLPHAGRLHVTTLAGDRHVFDVTTGDIVSTSRWEPPRLVASVTLAAGESLALSDVRLCGLRSPLGLAMGVRGVEAPWQLVATIEHKRSGDHVSSVSVAAIDLADVVRLDNENEAVQAQGDADAGQWFRLQAVDGSVRRAALAPGLAICGVDGRGAPREQSFNALDSVRLTREAAPEVVDGARRTVSGGQDPG